MAPVLHFLENIMRGILWVHKRGAIIQLHLMPIGLSPFKQVLINRRMADTCSWVPLSSTITHFLNCCNYRVWMWQEGSLNGHGSIRWRINTRGRTDVLYMRSPSQAGTKGNIPKDPSTERDVLQLWGAQIFHIKQPLGFKYFVFNAGKYDELVFSV